MSPPRARPNARRLLFVVNDGPYFLSHRLPVARAARAAGFDVHVATPDSPVTPEIVGQGFTFHAFDLSRSGTRPLAELRSFVQLVRLYRSVRPEIVHHVTIKPVLYGGVAARLTGVPAVVSAITGLGHVFSAEGFRSRLLRGFATRAYRSALAHPNSRVIFQNPDDRAAFLSAGLIRPGAAVLILGSGVDLDRFAPTPEPPGPPTVTMPSRMLWSKGVGDFVEAAARVNGRGGRARFALVGGVDPANPEAVPREQLEEWARSGVVEWWGFRSDMTEVLAASHAVCLPSRYAEGVPKSLIEAAAAGRPLVTTDTPGCREIARDGENGILVPAGDVGALASALERLIRDPGLRLRMGQRGRILAEREFGVRRVQRETLAQYAELTGAPIPLSQEVS